MGDGDHVLHQREGVVGEVGDIPGHLAALQGGDHVLVRHQAAPGQVDNAHAGLHLVEGGGVEHPLGVGRLGHVDGDVIAVFIDGGQIGDMVDQTGEGQGGVHGEEGVVAVDGHPQLGGDVGHLHPDGAQADDPQILAGDLGAHELALTLFHHLGHVLAGPGLGLHPFHAPHHVPGGQHQGAHRQLLDRVGVGAGGVEDHDAAFRAAVHGDVVGARPGPGNGPEGGGKDVFLHVGGADQNAVLVLHAVGDGEAGGVQHREAGGADLIQSFDTEHPCTLPDLQLFLSNARMKSQSFSTPSTGMAL